MGESSSVYDFMTRSEVVALLVLLAGLVVARLLSVRVGAVFNAVDRRAARYSASDAYSMSPRMIQYSRAFAFWIVLILALSLSLRVLGVGGINTSLTTVIDFMPKLLVAFAIVIAGQLLGLTSRHLLLRLGDGIAADSLWPRVVHGAIVVVAIVLGLQQIGVDISFVTRLILILASTVSAGMMLAYALGARQHVANLMARRELARLSVGDRIRIDGVEGEIVDIYNTGVDIATSEGIAAVPAARLAEKGFLRPGEADG